MDTETDTRSDLTRFLNKLVTSSQSAFIWRQEALLLTQVVAALVEQLGGKAKVRIRDSESGKYLTKKLDYKEAPSGEMYVIVKDSSEGLT